MNASTTPTKQLAWLDPLSMLSNQMESAIGQGGWTVQVARTLDELIGLSTEADAVAIRLGQDIDALENWLAACQDLPMKPTLICRVDRHQMSLAIRAAQLGAEKIVCDDELNANFWRDLPPRVITGNASNSPTPHTPSHKARSVVFVDPASQHLLALAQRVAQADVTALLVGPTGAGKEVLARVLHESSNRARGPFVALNCAAIPDHLIEDILFGHEKGAFTGAHKDHKGLFEQAQGGTLFLDEIGEMPLHLQSKLLRVLQEKQLTRLGGHQVIDLNVRIVAATNKDLKQAIERKEFREDLYYRIATFRMRLLPLRERTGDIIPLALQCLQQSSKSGHWEIDQGAQSLLLEYPWPGNVRELENVMRRAMVLCPGQTIGAAHLMFDDWVSSMDNAIALDRPLPDQSGWGNSVLHSSFPQHERKSFGDLPQSQPDLHSTTRMSEHQVIMATLAESNNREEAARRLGISPRTLRYKLAQFKAMGLNLAV